MYFLARFFFSTDLLFVPLCFILLFAIIRYKANQQKDEHMRSLYFKAFYLKIFFVFVFTFLTEFIFKGGDTGLYYQAITDMRTALNSNIGFLEPIFFKIKLDPNSPLFPYFLYDNYSDDITSNYMLSPSNYFVPKIGLIPSLLFNNSYICISMFFSFFALGGAIRLFKTFYYFFPNYWKEIALATLFLPDVSYWSSGILKDPICFGAIGFITYAVLNIFVKKQKILISMLILLICASLLFYIKVYILLVLAVSILIWQFTEFNKVIRDRTLRMVFSFFSFAVAALLAYFLVSYLTQQDGGQAYSLDTLLDQSANQRKQFGLLGQSQGGSYFEPSTGNPVLLVLNGISATFFRPFPWEVRSPIMLFSAIEALLFLVLTVNFMVKRGVLSFFTLSFRDPRTLMCFIFAIVFAVAVGSTTSNFGALSRYKIPCMPFYLLLLLILYRNTNVPYPKWFAKILAFTGR